MTTLASETVFLTTSDIPQSLCTTVILDGFNVIIERDGHDSKTTETQISHQATEYTANKIGDSNSSVGG